MAAITADDNAQSSSAWTTPLTAYCAFAVAAAIALNPALASMAKTWAGSSTYHHGFLVAPIALWMIYAARKDLAPAATAPSGHVIAALGAALWLCGRAAGVLLLEQAAFVTVLIGGAGIIFGGAALRRWTYPLAFLYLMVPFGEALIPALQTMTVHAVVAMLSIVGAKVSIDGTLIHAGGGVFEIAEACAGLRFLLAAVAASAALAYLSFNAWSKRLAFIAAAAVFAVLANAARAFVIILLASATDGKWTAGPQHVLIGWAFYAVALYLLIHVGRRIEDKDKHQTREIRTPSSARTPSPIVSILPALAILIAVSLYDKTIIERPVHHNPPASITLLNAPGWRILPPPENWRAQLGAADRRAAATYASPDHTVYVSIAYFSHDREGGEIVNTENRSFDGAYWRMTGTIHDVVYLFGASQERPFELLTGPQGRHLAVVSAYWLKDRIYLKPWRMKLAQMKAKLTGRNPPGGLVMIAARYERDPSEAVAAIRAYTSDVEPFAAWLARNNGG